MALYFTLARVTAAGLLFWAVSLPSLNSHLFFRLAIFVVAAWGFGRAIKEEPGLFLVLFYPLVAVAFNPFSSRFERETWVSDRMGAGDTIFTQICVALVFGLCPVILGFNVGREHLLELLKRT